VHGDSYHIDCLVFKWSTKGEKGSGGNNQDIHDKGILVGKARGGQEALVRTDRWAAEYLVFGKYREGKPRSCQVRRRAEKTPPEFLLVNGLGKEFVGIPQGQSLTDPPQISTKNSQNAYDRAVGRRTGSSLGGEERGQVLRFASGGRTGSSLAFCL